MTTFTDKMPLRRKSDEVTRSLRSMTGFGSGRANDGKLSVTVEIRSVNNRFWDLSLKLPRPLYIYEPNIRELLRQQVSRGRITLVATEEWMDSKGPALRINPTKAARYAQMLRDVQQRLQLSGEVRLEHLLTFDDLLTDEDDEEYRQRLWALCEQAVQTAVRQMVEISYQEGMALYNDLRQRLNGIRDDLARVKGLEAAQISQYHQRLRERLEELLGDGRLDPDRLEMEMALVSEKLDISEEITRLASHIELFEQKMEVKEPVGKTLGFILQEMGREVNTIASKSWLVEISQMAMGMKEVIEQMREQVQNIE